MEVGEGDRVIRFSVPLPPKQLHPNHAPFTRKGCIAKARHAKAYKGRVWIEALQFRPAEPLHAAAVRLHYYLARHNPRIDRDNLIAWFKHGQDALVAAGILVDDNQVTNLPPVIAKDKDNPRVEVEIIADARTDG